MKSEVKDDTVYLILEEKIDLVNAEDLKEMFMDLLDQGYLDFALDFGKVRMIDSSGLGKILLMQKILQEKEGSLKIINIESEYVKKMFRMVHLSKLVNIEE